MPTGAEYEQKISAYGWDNLLELGNDIEAGFTPDWEPGKALEYLVLRAFQLEGAQVTFPYSVSIEGEELEQIDGVVYSDGLACLTECKATASRANIEPIAKMRNQLLRRPASTIGIVFSLSGFTYAAITLARYIAPQTILLWNGDEIRYALERQHFRPGLLEKYRFCIEQGIPNYDIRAED
ncbi:MAG: restriction endonuclease [Coleofasciculaceae cyanobacterium]